MNQRVAKWDNLKFVLIFLVVLGHFVDYYESGSPILKTLFLFIYSFHIPAFLFVSGLMSKKTVNTTPFPVVRVMSLLSLYLVCNGLMLLCKAAVGKSLELNLFGQDSYAWFMFALPAFYVLTHVFRGLPAPFAMGVFIAVGCLAGYDPSIGDTLHLSRILVFYPFFLAGYYFDSHAVIQFADRLWVRIASAMTLLTVFVGMYLTIDRCYALRPLFTGRNSFAKAGAFFETYGGPVRLLYYVAVAVLILAVVSVIPTGKTFFTKMGSRTLQVYVLHRPILYLMQTMGFGKALRQIMPQYWWIPFFGAAVIMTFVLAVKWLEPPFARLMNPAKKNQ